MPRATPLAPAVIADSVADPQFWKRHFPALSIGAAAWRWENPLDDGSLDDHLAQLKLQGYGRGTDRETAAPAKALARAVQKLVDLGLSPVFIFLFDQTWALFHRQGRLLRAVLGDDYKVCTDYWAWHVDPKKDQAGWSPHRDQGRASVNDDGTANVAQLWLPLSDANPLNGCIYVLPADRDPRYRTEHEMDFVFDVPNIRALPAKPGDYLFWNGALLHWGSRSSPRGTHPRISMAVSFQRAHPPKPYTLLALDPQAPQDFGFRLAMVAKQLMQYRHKEPLDPKLEAVLRPLARPYVRVLGR
ncbi:MAG: phytanoyl-CoA dioxygenase family protein [Archangiaceae bacterium]|nr:phytanoyl-CoA dioxygenase family protein [Archangiaceae bacterium]